MADIIDGKSLADKILAKLRLKISESPFTPGLAVILVGNDPASELYVRLKQEACKEVGLYFEKHLFNALTQKDIGRIVDIQLAQVEERLKGRGIHLNINSAVKAYLAKNGFDPDYGARPIKRLIQKVIVDALADKMIRGAIKDGQKISITLRGQDRVEVAV